jgi:hypothetical protein
MKKIFIGIALLLMLLNINCKNTDCVLELADLLFKSITSNKQANNGEIKIQLGETVQFTSKVLNEFVDGKCDDWVEKADSSKLKAILYIVNEAGTVLGSLDTLYGVDPLDVGFIDTVMSKVKFKSAGLYELEFIIDALNKVDERDESNNTADVFK